MEWVDDHNMWVAVPPARALYLIDPETMEVKRSIPTPGARPHGIFLRGDSLWCADTTAKRIYRLDAANGDVLDAIDIPAPEVHGVTLRDGEMWFLLRHYPPRLHRAAADLKAWQTTRVDRPTVYRGVSRGRDEVDNPGGRK